MRVLSLLFILLSASFCKAQNVSLKGNNRFEKKWVTPETYQMRWYMQRDTQLIEMGLVKTEVKINPKSVLLITTVRMKNTKSDWIDSSMAERAGFRPVFHTSYNTQRDIVLKFGKIVRGVYNDKTKKTSIVITDTTHTDYFDSNLYPYLIRLLPLKEGFTTTIPIYDFNPDGKKGVLSAVVKAVIGGKISQHGQEKEVWIVTVTDEIGSDSSAYSTYYIGKADRKLLKQEMNIRGRKMVMLLED